jgi:hypothetical protein
MITRSTVFILGAGASEPYGYPSGRGLVKVIIKALSNQSALYQLCIGLEYDPREIADFLKTLTLADPPSIDSFLETKRKSEKLGKTLIGLALFMKENPDALTTLIGEEEGGKWYGDLVNKLKTPAVDDFSKNEVSFLTFNYDRSFDHYLFTSIKHSYDDLSDDKCAEIVRTIPIIHLHGQIGKLPWQNEHGEERPYQNTRNEIELLIKYSKPSSKKIDDLEFAKARHFVNEQISGQIKIIHENELDNDPAFKDAHKRLERAERIYFLGFGYNDENLRRLRFTDLERTTIIGKTIEGTAHGIGEVRRNQIHSASKIELHENYKVKEFIRERVDFS